MDQKPKLEFEPGKKYKVKLLFDTPKSGQKTNPNGKTYTWYLYGVEYNNAEYTFFADYSLQNKLSTYSRGDILEISDQYMGDEPFRHQWEVFSVGSDKPLDEFMKEKQDNTGIKIEVFASMKIASAFSKDLDELKVNTHGVIALHEEICKVVKDERDLF